MLRGWGMFALQKKHPNKELLVMNLDETSICFTPATSRGYVVSKRRLTRLSRTSHAKAAELPQ